MHSLLLLLTRTVRRVIARADAAMNRIYGWKYNPLYQSGSLAGVLLLILVVTGVYLILFYRVGSPYESMVRISEQVWLGRWIRTMHRYSADALLVAVAVHAFRMFAQRRSWGPRALAWVSGSILLFLIFVCGWTGYVLVWDTHAQALAVAGARLLDGLPIFSEPISRTFVGEQPMPSAFFFINFFLHVALPLGLGLLLWVHVARVARPSVLAAKRAAWTLTGLLFAVSVLWPIGMGPEADLLRLPGKTPADLFYSFWLPLIERGGPGLTWGAFLLVAGAILLVPRWTRSRAGRPAPSVVDERSCTGCEQCYHDCPFEAISMVDRSDGREGMVARVDPDLCVSCGICAGSCAPMVVGPPGRTGRAQLAAVKEAVAAHAPAPSEVVLIACDKGAGGITAAGAPEGVRLHPVSCAGTVHSSVIEYYLRAGAAGVMVAACPARDCWNREGAKWAEARIYGRREAELQERVDRARVHLAFVGEKERGLLLAELSGFRARLAAMGGGEAEEEIDLLALCEREVEGSAGQEAGR